MSHEYSSPGRRDGPPGEAEDFVTEEVGLGLDPEGWAGSRTEQSLLLDIVT